MKAFSKLGLLLAVALLATAAVATAAQAETISPNNAHVTGEADFPTLDYEGVPIICNTGTAEGDTGTNSDRIVNLALEFFGDCGVAGVLPATVDCSGTVTLIAQNDTPAGGTGTADLNEDFLCEVTTDLCVVTVAGPQSTQPDNLSLDETANQLSADVDVEASNNGNEICGPPTGTGNFTAVYDVLPTDLAINP
jgi:hypothetical protein